MDVEANNLAGRAVLTLAVFLLPAAGAAWEQGPLTPIPAPAEPSLLAECLTAGAFRERLSRCFPPAFVPAPPPAAFPLQFSHPLWFSPPRSLVPAPPDSFQPLDPEPDLETRRIQFRFTDEFRNQPGLALINADYAYARGATGAGVTLGVIDTGINRAHIEFAAPGKLHPDSDLSYGTNIAPDALDHGTAVAGVMAARRDPARAGDNMHGVAFDAQVLSLGIPLSEPDPDYVPVETSELNQPGNDVFFARRFQNLNAKTAAINLSFGVPGNIERYNAAELRAILPQAIAAAAQRDVAPADRAIYVWAAGNAQGRRRPDGTIEEGRSVELLPGLPYLIPELQGHYLATVGVDTDTGRLADFSSHCGVAAAFCLAAPATFIMVPYRDGYTTVEFGGTSLAAPLVTGAVGLLTQYYRDQLGADEIVDRLLATANKTGIYADAQIYGQGLLDLDAATRPQGEARLPIGASLAGPAVSQALSSLASAPAFGDALSRGLAGREIAAFDSLNAPFFSPLNSYLRRPAPLGVEERLHALGGDPRGGLRQLAPGFGMRLRTTQAPVSERGFGLAHRLVALGPGTGGVDRVGAPEHRLDALWLSGATDWGRVFLGLRGSVGWDLGLYAAGALRPGAFSDEAAFVSPYLALARDGGAAGLEWTLGRGALRAAVFHGGVDWDKERLWMQRPGPGLPQTSGPGRNYGALLEYGLAPGAGRGVALQAGWLWEPGSLMGSRPQGAFGGLRGQTGFAGLAAHARLGDRWMAFAAAHAGWSCPSVEGAGLLRGVSALRTSSFELGATRHGFLGEDGRLSLRLSQPLRVESGHAALRWAAGRTRYRQLLTEQARLNLEPSGRQLDLELAYRRPWAGGWADLATIATRDARHTRGARELTLLFRYHRAF